MGSGLVEWLDAHFDEVDPFEFYRVIFPSGELEKRGEYIEGKYTGIVVAVTNDKKPDGSTKVLRYTLTDDLEVVKQVVDSEHFCLCAPISYAGKQRTAEHARMLYAIAVDVDKLRVRDGVPIGLENMWMRHISAAGRIPKPTFIVSSGTGVHLYYVLDKPLPMFYDVAHELQEYKRELTRLIWHDTIVDIKNPAEIQYEGIYQGFRMPGSVTKNGARARAFRTGERVSMEYLNGFVAQDYRAHRAEAVKPRNRLRLKDAQDKYPEWYQRRVVEGEKRGVWHVKRALYEWWRRKIYDGATVGHRYYCMMMLAIYAQKCSYYDEKHNPDPVTREELERDCFEIMNYMESLTVAEDNHFDKGDVLDALEAFDDRWTTYPRSAIEFRTAIAIPASRRNGQPQNYHLEEARAIRDIRSRRRGEKWDAHNGRKSKVGEVHAWRAQHPEGRKADCIRETGLDKKTVYKHWDQ